LTRDGYLDAERFQKATLLPPNAACEEKGCGASDPLTLDGDAAMVLCADHAALRDGRGSVEQHHLGGRRWDIVLDLTPNGHRIVTTLQRMRKGVTKGSTAELLYGIADLIYAIADYVNQTEKERPHKRVRPSSR
jgi:hypothetical protein